MCAINASKGIQDPTKVNVLMSFGSPLGDFEFAWALRNELQDKLGENTVYLDALSLKDDKNTIYPWRKDTSRETLIKSLKFP